MLYLSEVSNREKQIWADLLVDAAVTLTFFPRILAMEGGIGGNAGALAEIVIGVVVMAAIGGALVHGLLGVGRTEPRDERDIQFAARAHRVGYYGLCGVMAFLIGHIVLNEAAYEVLNIRYNSLGALQIATYMLLALVVVSFLKDLVKLFYYRRGY